MISAIPSSRRLALNPVRSADPAYWRRPRGTLTGLGSNPSQFPAQNPQASSSAFVNAFATAIASQEGYGATNSACTAINNPGCLRAGPGQIGTSAQGFAIFPDPETGWNALDSQIQSNINLGVDLNGFIAGQPGVYPGYAPSSDNNNTAAYVSYLSSSLNIPASGTPLSQLQASYDSGSPAASSGSLLSPDLASGSDSTDLGASIDMTPFLVAAGVLAAALMIR
jgi:hypothetical protein